MKRVKVLGHPVHPPTVHLPLGLWSAAAIWDAAALLTGRGELWTVGFASLALGCAAAMPALATGLLDFAALDDPADEPVAFWHMGLMATCWCFYGASLIARRSWAAPAHAAAAVALQFAGLLCLSIGGWLGGHLVYTRGVGTAPRQ